MRKEDAMRLISRVGQWFDRRMQLAAPVREIAEHLDGKLEYIAPKGKEKEGTIEFEVKAAVKLKQGVLVRANYSANADIILDTRKNVMAIEESLLTFEKGKAFVEVETTPQNFVRRELKLPEVDIPAADPRYTFSG